MALAFLLLIFILIVLSGRKVQGFLSYFSQLFFRQHDRESFNGNVLKFRVSEHCIICALDINSNGGLKKTYLESCYSTSKNKLFPLAQCIILTTKLGKVMTCHKSLLPIKSLVQWTMWSF